jgi:hypothetical protein
MSWQRAVSEVQSPSRVTPLAGGTAVAVGVGEAVDTGDVAIATVAGATPGVAVEALEIGGVSIALDVVAVTTTSGGGDGATDATEQADSPNAAMNVANFSRWMCFTLVG